MWKELKTGFTQRKGWAYILLLISLGIGYFSPIVAIILFLCLRNKEQYSVYSYCAIIGAVIALGLYLIQSITI